MSPEEMQRTMQFVVNQQAQFSADLAKLETNLASFANHVAASEARWTERFEQITGGLIGLTAITGQIASAQLRTDEQLRELRGGLSETDAHIRDVESHLNVGIEMFERHLREDHGRPPS